MPSTELRAELRAAVIRERERAERERTTLDRRVRDIAGTRHTPLAVAMRSYHSLAPKLTAGCRIIEAYKLFKLAKETGGSDEKEVVLSLLRVNGNSIYVECRCDDSECEFWNYDEEQEEGFCNCLDSDNFCTSVSIYTETDSGHVVYGGNERRRDR